MYFGSVSKAEDKRFENFEKEITHIIKIRPPYVWGGSVEKGVDCSGMLYLTAKRAGFPVRRTTSHRMSLGEGGWESLVVNVKGRQPLDLIFWTLKEKRPNGHVGVLYLNIEQVVHASSSKNAVVVQPLEGTLWEKITGVRRLQ